MAKILISQASADNASAVAIGVWLSQNGWDDYFLDISPDRGLTSSEKWHQAFRAAANRCEAVLFLISPAWESSRWCLAEFLLARQLGKITFGVIVAPTSIESLTQFAGDSPICDLANGDDRASFAVAQEPTVLPTTVSFARAELERLKLALQKSGLGPSTFAWSKHRPPYPGLQPLDISDAAVFFGRDTAIVSALDAIRRIREQGVERTLVILGASGAGKSSFLRAGLWPRLARNHDQFLPLPVIRPERGAISSASGLAASFEVAFNQRGVPWTRADIAKILERPGGLNQLVVDLQAQSRSGTASQETAPTVVIPIDQGEELFEAPGRGETDQFLARLAETLDAGAATTPPRVLAIFAVRSDSFARMQADARLGDIRPSLFNLSPISSVNLSEVIEGPARVAGIRLEAGLVPEIVRDAADGALPLLAFVLRELYEASGDGGWLTVENYRKLGGLRETIARRCESAVTHLTEPAAAELRRAFLKLVQINDEGEYSRRVARWDEFPEAVRPLVEQFVDSRVLVMDARGGELVVEVVHEGVLRYWDRLRVWLDEYREVLRLRGQLARAARLWDENHRDGSFLFHGLRLSQFDILTSEYLDLLDSLDRAFLEASRAMRDSEITAARSFSGLLGDLGMRALRTRIEGFRGEYDRATAEYKTLTQRLEALKRDLEAKEFEMNKMAPLVFISYAREDYARVVDIYNSLEEKGLRPWMDKKDLMGGTEWEVALAEVLEKADFIVVCLSDRSVKKQGFIQKEMRMAVDRAEQMPIGSICMIPVRLDQTEVPRHILRYNYIDLFEPDGFGKLVTSILHDWRPKQLSPERT